MTLNYPLLDKERKRKSDRYARGRKGGFFRDQKANASTGNRAGAAQVAGEHSATKPPSLTAKLLQCTVTKGKPKKQYLESNLGFAFGKSIKHP